MDITPSMTPQSEDALPQLAQGERRNASDHDMKTYPHRADRLPSAAWAALIVGGAERLAFFSMTTPWQNYMQNPLHDRSLPGALGLGQSTATNIFNGYLLFAALMPTPFALLSDIWLGPYRTLVISLCFYMLGALALLLTSIPDALDNGAGVGGLAAGMVLIGIGQGGVKAIITPFIGDQYTHQSDQLVHTHKGEYIIADRSLTLQYIYNVYYWFINVGGLSMIPATFLEKFVGFWAAFLVGTAGLSVAFIVAIIWRNRFVKAPASGNVLPEVGRVLLCAAQNGFRLSRAEPAYQLEKYSRSVPWSKTFVAGIGRGLLACRYLLAFVIFYLCYNQMSNNLVSQAGQMKLGNVPNDMIQVLNAVACVILGPVIQQGLFPLLQKCRIPFGPIARTAVSFIVMAGAMAIAAGIQKIVYDQPPCYRHPLECPDSEGGAIPNAISVWIQTPVYPALAVAEILGFATAYEYSYSKAPKELKAMVQAITQLIAGVGAALGMAVSPAAKNPDLIILYAALAGTMIVTGLVFWCIFYKYDKIDAELDRMDNSQTSENLTSESESEEKAVGQAHAEKDGQIA